LLSLLYSGFLAKLEGLGLCLVILIGLDFIYLGLDLEGLDLLACTDSLLLLGCWCRITALEDL